MKRYIKKLLLNRALQRFGLYEKLLKVSTLVRAGLPYRAQYEGSIRFLTKTEISEITPLNSFVSTNRRPRISLFIPSLKREHAFGGVSTAVAIFDEVKREYGSKFDYRIVSVDSPLDGELIIDKKEYADYEIGQECSESQQLIAINDRYGKEIDLRINDRFIATSWWTAYLIKRLIEHQIDSFGDQGYSFVYLIQDYEPGFYSWSSRYALAESTYKGSIPIKAVFNTSILRSFFRNQGYSFYKEYCFDPVINKAIYELYDSSVKKRKKIIAYGRPSVSRNLFELVVLTLKEWDATYPTAKEWEVVSLGEPFPDIKVSDSLVIRSLGKLSLREYAKEMNEASLGISFMLSPHPSYPPLEMAHFGVNVLTNSYANKDLASFHSLMHSVSDLNPASCAARLRELCERHESNLLKHDATPNSEYVKSGEEYLFVRDLYDFDSDQFGTCNYNDMPHVGTNLWIDRPDAGRKIADLTESDEAIRATRSMISDGYVHLGKVLSERECDDIYEEFLRYCSSNMKESTAFTLSSGYHSRLCNFHLQSEKAAGAITNSRIMSLLDFWFGEEAAVCSSLLFEQGSEQAVHRDSPFFCTQPYGMFFGVWFALEDIDTDAGPLVYFRGAHKLHIDRFELAKGRSSEEEIYSAYIDALHAACEESRLPRETAMIKKGDAFIWHPELPHGGGQIRRPGKTRKSIVFHCMPRSVPVYGVPEFFGLKRMDGRRHSLIGIRNSNRYMIDHGEPKFDNNY